MFDVPEIGVGAAYGHGWRHLWKHFGVLLGITIVMLLICAVPGGIQESGASNQALLSVAYQIFVLGPVTYGGYCVYLKAARDERPAFSDLFAGFGNYWQVVLASFVVGLIVTIGFVFLIVPGIIFICKLVFVPYLVVDRKMRAFDAINESWRMTDGISWIVFFMLLLAIPIAVAGVMALGVGIIVSIMWIGLAFAAVYLAVFGSREADRPMASSMTP
jgi:uncharacterized membrane protein